MIKVIQEDIVAAFMLLTRLPIKSSSETPPDLNRSHWVYPLVGLVIALIGSTIFMAANMLNLPHVAAILLALIAMVLTTGAFHEDGLADMADGFGGGATPEKKLTIMRDSRIGTYGGVALIFAFALKISSLAAITPKQVILALIVGSIFSRVMIIIALMLLAPARKDSLSVKAGKPTIKAFSVAIFISFFVSVLCIDIKITAFIFLAAFFATAVLCRIAYKQVGGFSGDILGAVQQISEIAIFLTLASLWSGQ